MDRELAASTVLPRNVMAGWAIGELAIATYIGLSIGFMLFYCTQALKIPPALAGTALLLPRLLDAVWDPMMGTISDRTRSRFGRRRVWLLVSAPLLGASFAGVFFLDPALPLPLRVTVLTLLFLISNLAVSIYEVPYAAMAAEMTGDYHERTRLTGWKMIAARIGIILALLVGPLLIGAGATPVEGFRMLGLAAGAFMTVTGLIAFFATGKAPRLERPPGDRPKLAAEWRAMLANRPFRILWLIFLLQNLAIGVAATALVYLLTYVMGIGSNALSPFLSAAAIAAALATPAWVPVARRLGKRDAYRLVLVMAAIAALLVLPTTALSRWAILAALALVGIVDAGTQLLPNAMVPDTVEIDQAATGTRREGALFGAWGLCRKLGMTAGAFLVSIGLELVGFRPGIAAAQQEPGVLTGIALIYAGVPALLWAAAALVSRRYDLTEAEFEAAKHAIRARATAPAEEV